MYDQNTSNYNLRAYTETGFAFNLSTDQQISYALPGRFKWINGSGIPVVDPTGCTTMLLSLYDINGNNVLDALSANMSNNFPLYFRDPTNNSNQMFFTVTGGVPDSNQITVTMSVNNVLGTFTAENMYILGFEPPETIEDLKDTNISSPTTGDLLTFQSSNNSWVNQQPSQTSLANDSDVALSNPQNGDLLTYQTSSSNWVNQQPATPPTISMSAYCELVSGTGSISMTTVGDWYDVETATVVFNNNNSSFASNVFTNPSNGLIQYQRYSAPS